MDPEAPPEQRAASTAPDSLAKARRAAAVAGSGLTPSQIKLLTAQKSIRALFALYSAGSVSTSGENAKADDSREALLSGSITARRAEKTLKDFLIVSKDKTSKAQANTLLPKQDRLHSCILKRIPLVASRIIDMLETNGKPGIQWSEFKEDWSYDAPFESRPDTFRMKNMIADTMKNCESKVQRHSMAEVKAAFSSINKDGSRSVCVNEMELAVAEAIKVQTEKRNHHHLIFNIMC